MKRYHLDAAFSVHDQKLHVVLWDTETNILGTESMDVPAEMRRDEFVHEYTRIVSSMFNRLLAHGKDAVGDDQQDHA